MKKLHKFLAEKQNESTAMAKELGLAYAGGGYWRDPKTGKVTYETKNDKLVPYSGPGEPNQKAGAMAGPAGMAGVPQPGQGALQAMAAGTGVGPATDQALDPDNEDPEDPAKAPSGFNQGQGWDPGPDGDTCVGGEEPKPVGIPQDTFVRRGQNSKDWTSGPDGSNFMNSNFNEWLDSMVGDPLVEAESPRAQFMQRVKGERSADNWSVARDAKSALGKMATTDRNRELASMARTRQAQGQPKRPGANQRAKDAERAAMGLPGKLRDADRVEQMNSGIGQFVKDKNFDLDDVGEELGAGAFGSVYLSPDGKNVIKQGEIGADELKALHAMRNNPGFPTVMNARFDTPFRHQSSEENNPLGDNPADSKGNYFDPNEQSGLMDAWPTAQGTYAMSRMNGGEFYEKIDDFNDEKKEDIMRQVFKLRAQMHEQGIAHNDMHAGNVYLDDDGNASILDMGLANMDPRRALMEALGGISGEDFQLGSVGEFPTLPSDLQELLTKNKKSLRMDLMDELDPDLDDPEDLEELLNGGIRLKGPEIDQLQGLNPWLGDEERVKGMIKKLYGGVVSQELQSRMGKAYDRNRDIINPKNLD